MRGYTRERWGDEFKMAKYLSDGNCNQGLRQGDFKHGNARLKVSHILSVTANHGTVVK